MLACQGADLLEQIGAQRAADAAIAHLDQLIAAPVQRYVAPHLLGIDVDLAHIIDDDRNAQAVAIAQDMVEEGGFAGAEEAGKHRHRQSACQGAAHHAFTVLSAWSR